MWRYPQTAAAGAELRLPALLYGPRASKLSTSCPIPHIRGDLSSSSAGATTWVDSAQQTSVCAVASQSALSSFCRVAATGFQLPSCSEHLNLFSSRYKEITFCKQMPSRSLKDLATHRHGNATAALWTARCAAHSIVMQGGELGTQSLGHRELFNKSAIAFMARHSSQMQRQPMVTGLHRRSPGHQSPIKDLPPLPRRPGSARASGS